MRAILPLDVLRVDQLHVRLVHERRWLERVPIALVSHMASGDATELGMNQRDQLRERSFIPSSPGNKEVRNFGS
jgi:hypothetical protein